MQAAIKKKKFCVSDWNAPKPAAKTGCGMDTISESIVWAMRLVLPLGLRKLLRLPIGSIYIVHE